MTEGTSGQSVSFERDIKPLFRERDRRSMQSFFDLWSYEDVRDNAELVYERLADGSMPCDGGWPAQDVERFRRWIDEGRGR
jgi:hypothetical protein